MSYQVVSIKFFLVWPSLFNSTMKVRGEIRMNGSRSTPRLEVRCNMTQGMALELF
jgi:hypothetical protein